MTATDTVFNETQRRTRGHAFLPPQVVRRKTPALYATEAVPLADKLVVAHYFAGGFDWYVVEADWTTGEAFGLVKHNGDVEWGYFWLGELEAIRPRSTFTATPAKPLSEPVAHEHPYEGQTLHHTHEFGAVQHGYFEHPEDGHPYGKPGVGAHRVAPQAVVHVGSGTLQWVVERDCFWTPVRAAELLPAPPG